MGSNERTEVKNLLKRCRNGEPDAWHEFHRKFGGRIEQWASLGKAEDDGLLREVYAQIAADLESSRSSRSYETDLRRSVLAVAINHLRTQDTRTSIHLGDARGLASVSSANAKGLDAAWQMLAVITSKFSADEQTLLTMRFRDSLSYAEITEQLRRDDVTSTLTRLLLKLADETQKLRLRTLSCPHDGFPERLLPWAEGLLSGDEAERAQVHAATCPSFKNDADTLKGVTSSLWIGYGTASLHPSPEMLVMCAEAGSSAPTDVREKVEVHSAFCAMCAEHLAQTRAHLQRPTSIGAPSTMSATLLQIVCPAASLPSSATPVSPPSAPAAPEKPAAIASSESVEQPRTVPATALATVLLLLGGALFVYDFFQGGGAAPGGGAGPNKPAQVAGKEAAEQGVDDSTKGEVASRPPAPEKHRPTKTPAYTAAAHPKPAPVAVKPKPAPVAAKPKPAPVAAKPKPAPVAAKPKPAPGAPSGRVTYARPSPRTFAARPAPVSAMVAAPPRTLATPRVTYNRPPTPPERQMYRAIRATLDAPELARLQRLEAKGGKAIQNMFKNKSFSVEIGVDPEMKIENVTVTTQADISEQQRVSASKALAGALNVAPTAVSFEAGRLPPPSVRAYTYRPAPQPIARDVEKTPPSQPIRLVEPVTNIRISPPMTPVEPLEPTQPPGPPSPPSPTPH